MPHLTVVGVHKSPVHNFSKDSCDEITLLSGLGVKGDAHMGEKVKHRYDARKTPDKPNLRQVHLIHAELFQELKEKKFIVAPGQLGENITTQGIDLLNLPESTILKFKQGAQIQITGLRVPCKLINSLQSGLMQALLDKDANGNTIRKSGVMSIVLEGGNIRVGDTIELIYPPKPFIKLSTV